MVLCEGHSSCPDKQQVSTREARVKGNFLVDLTILYGEPKEEGKEDDHKVSRFGHWTAGEAINQDMNHMYVADLIRNEQEETAGKFN